MNKAIEKRMEKLERSVKSKSPAKVAVIMVGDNEKKEQAVERYFEKHPDMVDAEYKFYIFFYGTLTKG